MRLANKVSIITGAGAGMGYAAAHLFAREGSKVAVVDFDEATGCAAAESPVSMHIDPAVSPASSVAKAPPQLRIVVP